MAATIAELIKARIAFGLSRKSIALCSQWAEKYRVMGQPFPGKWTFKYHPWVREMHDYDGNWVGQKAAQMAYTETALNRIFYTMDINQQDTLYVLPAKTPDAGDFSSGRFDTALQLSKHLERMFSDVKNIGHKKAGHVNLYIRGSRSRSGLKSIPVGIIIFDEVDEMNLENIPLAEERSSGQTIKQNIKISTPRIDNFGINKYFQETTQEQFFFPCPSCSKLINLEFPRNIVITAESIIDKRIQETYLICHECKNKLYHKEKTIFLANGKWVPKHQDRAVRGFHISQLYSSTVSPPELAKSYLKSLNDATEEQEFHNSKLGTTHAVKGSKLQDEEIENCVGDHKNEEATPQGIITLGVDVGKWLHYAVTQWRLPRHHGVGDINMYARGRLIAYGKLAQFEQLDGLMYKYRVRHAVIDAHPERRKATEFANRWYGYARICFYGNAINGKEIQLGTDEQTVTVDRTSWLDQSLGRFRKKTISIPCDTDLEYKSHMKALVRIYEKDKTGNPVGRYVKGNDEDHYAHAQNYSEIALPLAATINRSTNMVSPL